MLYPAKDRELAWRFSADANMALIELCGRLTDIHCPDDLHVTIRLTQDISSWDTLAAGKARVGRWKVELPAPTRMGVPVDELGYQALRRGYMAHISASLVTDIIGWECGNAMELYVALQRGRLVCGNGTGN